MIIKDYMLYNHVSPGLSEMERDMLSYIPPGGNWTNLPDKYNSKRLDSIRASGGRTTYYGRLTQDKPSYTVTTHFYRLPNGCNIHPTQERIISIREAARLQSFPDSYRFISSRASQYKQIGNAVPPLLGSFIAKQLSPQIEAKTIFDLFSGAGGLSEGFLREEYKLIGANEIVESYFETYRLNHLDSDNQALICGDITSISTKEKIYSSSREDIGVIIGGPPCQGFSLAGWRDPKDERNQLFRDYLEIVEALKPEAFVMENVTGILSMQKGGIIKEIIKSFENIGYHVLAPQILKADNYGVPQRRKRVVLVGAKSKNISFNVAPMFSYDDPSLPDPINVGEAISSLPPLGIKDGEDELLFDYEPKSAYDLYMADLIDFDEFYQKARERRKSSVNYLPTQNQLFT